MSSNKDRVSTAYSGIAATSYDERRFTTPQGLAFAELESERLRASVRDLPVPANVLEVGCGTGRFLEELARLGHDVSGLDPSAEMVGLTKERLAAHVTARVTEGEGAALPYDDSSFDFVYTIRVLNQTESEEYALRVVREIIRVTRPGGRMLIEFATRYRPTSRSQSTRLSISDIRRVASEFPDVRLVDSHGVLLFSQTLLERVPTPVLPLWMGLERRAARLLPSLSSRCYVTLLRDPFLSQ